MASVAPVVTSTVSGSTSRPQNRFWWSATATRNAGTPTPGGYWLTPPVTFAATSASSDGGPSVSGKHCPRLIAPVRRASADISAKIVDVYGRIRSTTMGRTLAGREPEAERTEVGGDERDHRDADAQHRNGDGHDGRSQHHHEQAEGQEHRRPGHTALAQPGELPHEPGIRPAQ